MLGHPTALPVAGEVYGYPPFWPAAFSPAPDELAELRSLCDDVSARFTAEWNRTVLTLDPAARPTTDAFAEHGDVVLYNYPAALTAGDERMLPPHAFLGSTLRAEAADRQVDEWMMTAGTFAYVSLGSFLSVRGDVLRRVAEALAVIGMRAAIATGSSPPEVLGSIPDDWLVRDYLPQVRLLSAARLAVTHGGNNSVTEAIGQGVPLVVLPLSTDQFAGAAAIERTGLGRALDPNSATVDELAAALTAVLDFSDDPRLQSIAADQAARPGPRVAYELLTARERPTIISP